MLSPNRLQYEYHVNAHTILLMSPLHAGFTLKIYPTGRIQKEGF